MEQKLKDAVQSIEMTWEEKMEWLQDNYPDELNEIFEVHANQGDYGLSADDICDSIDHDIMLQDEVSELYEELLNELDEKDRK